jgi:hypothetical protein
MARNHRKVRKEVLFFARVADVLGVLCGQGFAVKALRYAVLTPGWRYFPSVTSESIRVGPFWLPQPVTRS